VVGFDSIIPPGREGKITQKIDLKNVHGGEFNKAVTVTSNAKNQPSLRLVLKGVIKPIIGMTMPDGQQATYLSLTTKAGGATNELLLTTEKKDLQVKKVSFKVMGGGGGQPEWQADMPTFINFTMQKPDSIKADGSMTYKLVFAPKADLKDSRDGEYTIETNHPDRAELKIRGRLQVE
jgi:hypothetical protein